MEIKLSEPDLQFDLHIQDIAEENGCFASIKWSTRDHVRFQLVEHGGSTSQAGYDTQDRVIHSLLRIDPKAEIRTAKAIYKGLSDYERQKGL